LKKPFDSSVVKRNLNMLGGNGVLAPETDMFTGSRAGSELLHLPADIALNASPSGTYGSPIVNCRIMPTINYGLPLDLRKSVGKYLTNTEQNNYLLKADASMSSQNAIESAFDLAPINGNTIQFRPLLFETFGAGNMANVAGYEAQCPAKGLVVRKGRSRIKDSDVILSDEFFIRNNIPTELNTIVPQKYAYVFDGNLIHCGGLEYGSFHGGAWNISVFGTTDWRDAPAQAVGIITASCTKTAFKRIQFDTTCFIGMNNYRNLAQPVIPTWGGPALINAFNTTCLFVRIFHSWPKEQTIFDPRFFAVFHFNKGVENINPNTGLVTITQSSYTNGTKDILQDLTIAENYPGRYTADDYMNGAYVVPTLYNKTTPDVGIEVFLDKTDLSQSPLRESRGHWNINKEAVGALLPNTTRIKVCVPNLATIYQTNGGGQGFKVGHLFRVIGGDDSETIIRAKAVDGTGKITQFEFANIGNGFYNCKDFLTEADSLLLLNPNNNIPTSAFKLQLSPIGFVNDTSTFYIKSGIIIEADVTKQGPKEIVKSMLISPLTPIEDEVSGKGIVSSPITAGVNLNESNRDPNNKYDIFFHFHNDISHTMADAIDFGSRINSYQQFIETSMSFT